MTAVAADNYHVQAIIVRWNGYFLLNSLLSLFLEFTDLSSVFLI